MTVNLKPMIQALHFPHIYPDKLGGLDAPSCCQGDTEGNRRDLFANLATPSSPEKMVKHGCLHRASRKITLILATI